MPQLEFRMRVTVEATISPSEDPAKVRGAVTNVLGECSFDVQQGPSRMRVTSDDSGSLRRLHDQLRDRHVRAAARKLLLLGREGSKTTVMLNRQAAHAGVIALCGSESESPLGPVYLTIESDRLDDVLEWLTAYESG